MATGERTFVLTGALAGKTVTLGNRVKRPYPFIDGRMTVAAEHLDLDKIGIYVSRCWQAWPEGSPELKEAQARDRENSNGDSEPVDDKVVDEKREIPSDVPSTGKGAGEDSTVHRESDEPSSTGNSGVRSEGSRPSPEDIVEIIRSLDPMNDAQWTADGRPRVEVVNELLENSDFGRAEIELALPGFTREGKA